jgi:hypothetical protein
MRKIYFIGFLLLVFKCHAQSPGYFPILRYTFWGTDSVACDTLIFASGTDVMLIDCNFSADTVQGTYKFIANDTVIAEFVTSTGALHIPAAVIAAGHGPPSFKPYRTKYYLNLLTNKLSPVSTEFKTPDGDWIKGIVTESNRYSWYKAR